MKPARRAGDGPALSTLMESRRKLAFSSAARLPCGADPGSCRLRRGGGGRAPPPMGSTSTLRTGMQNSSKTDVEGGTQFSSRLRVGGVRCPVPPRFTPNLWSRSAFWGAQFSRAQGRPPGVPRTRPRPRRDGVGDGSSVFRCVSPNSLHFELLPPSDPILLKFPRVMENTSLWDDFDAFSTYLRGHSTRRFACVGACIAITF